MIYVYIIIDLRIYFLSEKQIIETIIIAKWYIYTLYQNNFIALSENQIIETYNNCQNIVWYFNSSSII